MGIAIEMNNVPKVVKITKELVVPGYNEEDIQKNWQKVAVEMQKQEISVNC